MKFFLDNFYNAFLLGIILISGGALLLPFLRRRGRKASLYEATQLINQGKCVLLDVREPVEFAAAHLRDAKNIPLKELATRVAEVGKDKTKSVIVICHSGTQSPQAAAVLSKAGFNDVYSLNGGLAAWRAQGLPVVQ